MFLLALTSKLHLDPARLADALTHVDLIVFDELGYLPLIPHRWMFRRLAARSDPGWNPVG